MTFIPFDQYIKQFDEPCSVSADLKRHEANQDKLETKQRERDRLYEENLSYFENDYTNFTAHLSDDEKIELLNEILYANESHKYKSVSDVIMDEYKRKAKQMANAEFLS